MGLQVRTIIKVSCDALNLECNMKEYEFVGATRLAAKKKAIHRGWSFTSRKCICPSCTEKLRDEYGD